MLRLPGLALVVAGLLVAVPRLPACSLCNADIRQAQTFRQEATQARLVLYGPLVKSVLEGTTGYSDLRIDAVLKNDKILGGQKTLRIPRWVPVDEKDPPFFLLFCEVVNDKLDPYRGVPVKSKDAVAYVKGALALDPADRTRTLLYYFDWLEHPDNEIAADAFLEFAKASDQEVARVAPKLSAAKLRAWVNDPKTATNRLPMYSFLLGGCGNDKDAALLGELLKNLTDQNANVADGFLTGYIQLRPKEGWEAARALLRDQRKPFTVRYAALRALGFYQGWRPQESRAEVLAGVALVLPQADMADIAVENLRRWQMWDLTPQVLALYGKKGHDAPIVRRAILRYALACPRPEASTFVDQRRRAEPDLIKDVEESMQFEKR
jgi:hypothetical protein